MVSLILGLLLAIPNPVYAAQSPAVSRLAGSDRYETACQIAETGWTTADNAILAYGENFPDALAAVPLAKKLNAPILLTNNDSLNAKTIRTLQELSVKNVYLVGGTGVISAEEENQLINAGYSVKRLGGADRYETAVKIAEEQGTVKFIAVTTGYDYADALSIGPIAAQIQMPIILAPQADITPAIQNYISSKEIVGTYIIGGQDIISDNTALKFKNPERIPGQDKYVRNIAILSRFYDDYYNHCLCLATGEDFADALTGAAYAAKINGAVALVKTDLPVLTNQFLQGSLAAANNITVFGGEGVVPAPLLQGISAAVKSNAFPVNYTDASGLGIEILQGGTSIAIKNQSQEINLKKSPFSIRFNLAKQTEFFQIACLGNFGIFDRDITGLPCRDADYFNGSTGYVWYDDRPYDSMDISNYGHHVLYYHSNESRRADLVKDNENFNRLEWKINNITFNSAYDTAYALKDAPVNSLFLVLFTDNNLNKIIDPGEFAKIKLNLE
jgi:putative cell wall-binding protein